MWITLNLRTTQLYLYIIILVGALSCGKHAWYYYACTNHSLLPSGSKPKWLYCMYTWILSHIAMSEWMCHRDQHSRWKATPWPHWTTSTTTDSRPQSWPVQHRFIRCCSSTPRGWSSQQNVNECNIPLKIWGGNVTQCLLHVGGK